MRYAKKTTRTIVYKNEDGHRLIATSVMDAVNQLSRLYTSRLGYSCYGSDMGRTIIVERPNLRIHNYTLIA